MVVQRPDGRFMLSGVIRYNKNILKKAGCIMSNCVRKPLEESSLLREIIDIHRLRLPTYTVEKICTVVILGLATVESLRLRWGQLLVNL